MAAAAAVDHKAGVPQFHAAGSAGAFPRAQPGGDFLIRRAHVPGVPDHVQNLASQSTEKRGGGPVGFTPGVAPIGKGRRLDGHGRRLVGRARQFWRGVGRPRHNGRRIRRWGLGRRQRGHGGGLGVIE
jgi:hypothetical protein